METVTVYEYYRFSGKFLDQWKLVAIRDDGVYEVYLHRSSTMYDGAADELYDMTAVSDEGIKLNMLEQSIHSAVDGAVTYIKVGRHYFHIEADVLETEE